MSYCGCKRIPLTTLLLFLICLGGSPVWGQSGNTVSSQLNLPDEISTSSSDDESDKILIEQFVMNGLDVWSRSDVMSVLEETGLQTDKKYDQQELQQKVDQALRNLQKEGLFSDIQVKRNEVRLIFNFEEYRRISSIQFEGNEAFEQSKLMDVLLLQQGDPASPFNLKNAREQIRQFYKQKGYYDVTVNFRKKISQRKQAVIIFEIDQGRERNINEIEFVYKPEKGVVEEALRNWNLRMVVPLKPGDPYSRQVQKATVARITNWYSNRGYMEAQVDVKLWKNLNEGGIDMRFVIEEGPVFNLGTTRFRGNDLYSDTELFNFIPLEKDAVFSAKAYQRGLEKIRRNYTDRGYANVNVSTLSTNKRTKSKNQPTVNFSLRIQEGEPVYVQRIEIHGNHRTYDKVIRREIKLSPGELLDGEKKRNSLRRLRNLGFFEDVKLKVDPGKEANWKIVRVQVNEGRTGQFQFGGGFSSSTGFLGNLSIKKDNFSLWDWSHGFTGRAQSIQASAQVGQRQDNFNISWDDPWFNDDLDEPNKPSPDRPLGLGWSAFNVTNNREEGFDEIRQGGSLRLSREFGPARSNKIEGEYSFENSSVTGISGSDTDDIALDIINEAQGGDGFDQKIGSLNLSLSRDRRDNQLFPTEGYFLSGSNRVSSEFLAGDLSFYNPNFEARSYIPFWGSTFWALKFNYETIATWKDDSDSEIPSTEKFFLGGDQNVRGYEFRDIAIYDGNGQKLGGGQSTFHSSAEFRFQLMEESMQLFAFADLGNVYKDAWNFDLSNTKKSAGLGFRVRSPMGPINISWAQRLEQTYPGAQDDGETQIDFNIGTGF